MIDSDRIDSDRIDVIARDFYAAQRANQPYAPPSTTAALTMDHAYGVQRAFVRLRSANEQRQGYKAAANTSALQAALGLGAPITGVLFANGERANGCTVAQAA